MNFGRSITLPLLVLSCWLLGSCGEHDLGEAFELVPGTREVLAYDRCISIAPDGEFMVFLTDSVSDGGSARNWHFGICSMEIRSGVVRQHYLSDTIQEYTRTDVRRFIANYGLLDSFAPDSWRDEKFFVYTPDGCLRIDPRTDAMEVGKWSCSKGLEASGYVQREFC